jgi:hypothetical protein
MMPLPQFLELVKAFEIAVKNRTMAEYPGHTANERRAVREAYAKAKLDLEIQIMSLY